MFLGRFRYGVESYLCRVLDWEKKHGIPGMSKDQSYTTLLGLVKELKVSLVRDGSQFDSIWREPSRKTEFGTMERFLGDMRSEGIMTDWRIVSTPNWEKYWPGSKAWDDTADILYPKSDPYTYPPIQQLWSDFIDEIAKKSENYKDGIIYEIWNEPNHSGAWSGTPERYYDDLLNDAATRIKGIVTNGGMVTSIGYVASEDREDDYYKKYRTMLQNGSLALVSIHSHGTIDDLHNDFNNNVSRDGIENRRILLNESGYQLLSDGPDYERNQAKHTAGKAIWAHANGLAGYVAFYLGAISRDVEENRGLSDGDPTKYDYSMVESIEVPGDETIIRRKPVFYAYQTVIRALDDATFDRKVADEDVANSRYEYLFSKGTQQKIYVAIGNPGAGAKAASVLGTTDYEMYDMLGNVNGDSTDIQYFVTPLTITTQPQPGVANVGGSVEFTVAAEGMPPFYYQWQRDNNGVWEDIPNEQGTSYRFENAQASDTGARFRVLVSNDARSISSDEAILTVTVMPLEITTHPKDIQAAPGEAVEFTVEAKGTPPLSYQWWRDTGSGWTQIPGATSATHRINSVQASDNGSQFYVVVSDDAGASVDSNPAVLTVLPAPPTGLKGVKPTTKGGNDGKITGATAAMEYSADEGKTWTPSTGTEITSLSAGTYYVRFRETDAAEASKPATVDVPEGTAHTVTVGYGANGTASANLDKADPGTTVRITAMPSPYYRVDKVTYTPEGGSAIDITNGRSFTMPDANVTVDVAFVAAPIPAAPTGLAPVAPTAAGGTGKITGVSDLMEYSSDGKNWTPCTGTEITGLAPGTYYVRLKATDTTPVGEAATVIVPEYSGGGDDDKPEDPPNVDPNTQVEVISNDGRTVVLLILDANGTPLARVRLWFWLELLKLGGAAETAAEIVQTFGPFEATTDADGHLNIDVDNLIYAAGSNKGQRANIPAGEYRIRYADAETQKKHAGVTDAITLSATSDAKEENNGSRGGGCSAGLGGLVLATLAAVALKRRA